MGETVPGGSYYTIDGKHVDAMGNAIDRVQMLVPGLISRLGQDRIRALAAMPDSIETVVDLATADIDDILASLDGVGRPTVSNWVAKASELLSESVK